MSEQRNQVNVRLTDDEKEKLDEVANSLRVSRSEVIRRVLSDELTKVSKTRVTLTDNERRELLVGMSKIVNKINANRRSVRGVGNNVNQIAKKLNQGQINQKDVDLRLFIKEFSRMSSEFEAISSEVHELWQSLV